MNKLNLMPSLIYTMMIIMMMMIMWSKLHPTHLIMLIMIYSMLISLNLSMLKKTFIYSIMLFLIMISGILIIFLYFSSLISNEKIELLNLKKMLFTMLILTSPLTLMYKSNSMLQPINKCNELDSIYMNQINMFKNIEWIYSYPFNSMSIMCMMFLLLTMFTIIKIISTKSSSLRKINYEQKYH